jgi:hypothetical protein
MAIPYICIAFLSIPRPFKIYQNWDFWFENKPSGNPHLGFFYKKNLTKKQLGRCFLTNVEFNLKTKCNRHASIPDHFTVLRKRLIR